MAKLFGAQKMVLQVLKDLSKDPTGSVRDERVAEGTSIAVEAVRDWFRTLENERLIEVYQTITGLSASISPEGRLALQNTEGPLAVRLELRTKFLHSMVLAKEFADIALLINPYSDFLDPTDDPMNVTGITVYLWVPEPSYFMSPSIPKTTVVAICDAGTKEIQKFSDISFESLEKDIYIFSPSKLLESKRTEFIGLMGYVLERTFILAAVIPSPLLGGGLKDPRLSYQTILDLFLLPLVTAHDRLGFQSFHLRMPNLDQYSAGTHGMSKRIIKSAFKGAFSTRNIDRSHEHFYSYAGRFIAWAVGRQYNFDDPAWVNLLLSAFNQLAGPPSRWRRTR